VAGVGAVGAVAGVGAVGVVGAVGAVVVALVVLVRACMHSLLPPGFVPLCCSYHDRDTPIGDSYETTKGFTNLYALRDGPGARFVDLLDSVSR
jgi:hypothetical protein